MKTEIAFMDINNHHHTEELLAISASLFGSKYHDLHYFEIDINEKIITASCKNKIVGFLKIIDEKRNTVKIDCIAVKKEFQRKGIGSNMMSFYLEKYHDLSHKIIAHAWKSPKGIHAQYLNQKFGMKFQYVIGKIWKDDCGKQFKCPFLKTTCQCEAVLFSTE